MAQDSDPQTRRPDERSCCQPAPDRSGRQCNKPLGHDGDHWTYGGHTLTWSDPEAVDRSLRPQADETSK
jgi:hypothetical protein